MEIFSECLVKPLNENGCDSKMQRKKQNTVERLMETPIHVFKSNTTTEMSGCIVALHSNTLVFNIMLDISKV